MKKIVYTIVSFVAMCLSHECIAQTPAQMRYMQMRQMQTQRFQQSLPNDKRGSLPITSTPNIFGGYNYRQGSDVYQSRPNIHGGTTTRHLTPSRGTYYNKPSGNVVIPKGFGSTPQDTRGMFDQGYTPRHGRKF